MMMFHFYEAVQGLRHLLLLAIMTALCGAGLARHSHAHPVVPGFAPSLASPATTIPLATAIASTDLAGLSAMDSVRPFGEHLGAEAVTE